MATDNVEFYARMQKLQEMQQNREKQRVTLEQEFNTYLKSDKRLNKVRASKLQSYWTKICEDERHSRAAMNSCFGEYNRVDAHVAALSARTDRLRLLKDQYKKQIEMMYPRWQEQVEIKRRQQLLQQQKEQQRLAQRVQQLQQQQRPQGQQQRQTTQPQYLPQQQQQEQLMHQQHIEQMALSNQQQPLQIINLSDDYNHFKHTSPLIPDIRFQTNTPPLQDPRYATIQFGTQPQNLSYGVSTTGPGFSADRQGVNTAGSYEVPSTASMFGQPRMQNGSPSYSQEGPGAVLNGQVGPATDILRDNHLQYSNGEAEYTQLHRGGRLTRLPAQGPSGSSVYTDIQYGEAAGARPQVETFPQAGSQAVTRRPEAPQTAPALSKHENAVPTITGNHSSTYNPPALTSTCPLPTAAVQPARVPRGKTPQNDELAKQAVKKTVNDSDDDNDGVVTPLNDEDLYLTPAAVKSSHPAGEHTRRTSSELLKPLDRTDSATSGKAIATARTDPFTSEDDDEDDNSQEDTSALRDALQRQLHVRDDEAAEKRRNTMATDVGQRRAKEEGEEKAPKAGKGGKADGEEVPVAKQPRQIQEPKSQAEEDKDKEELESDSEDEDEEIGSDMSLPLSDTGETGPSAGNTKNPVGKKPPSSQMAQDVTTKVATVTVTEQGFWRLVSAVEQEIDQSDNIEKIYNLPECTKAIKMEIVRTVNNSGSLDHLDPNAISMVVLQQLQQIIQALPGGCLLSDKLLNTNRPITEVTVRSFLYSSALGFWDKLLQHLVLLIRKGVMDAEDVASMVAPLLISPDSTMANKATDVLTTILQDLEQLEDSQLDDTNSTLPSASATPSHISSQPMVDANQHRVPPEVPPLDLGDTADHDTHRVSHDSFFDDPVVPLTETKAYQQMMQNSQGTAKLTDHDGKGDGKDNDEYGSSDDEDDDEIERATRLTPDTPSSSRNKKRRNVLSSFGGNNSLGLSYGDDDERGGRDKDEGGETMRSEHMSDLISSPSPSPSPKGSAYVPSAMEQSLKSTGRSDPMQRSAAFWGEESDMEESEMSVPMGTMKSDDLKDDFDFYD